MLIGIARRIHPSRLRVRVAIKKPMTAIAVPPSRAGTSSPMSSPVSMALAIRSGSTSRNPAGPAIAKVQASVDRVRALTPAPSLERSFPRRMRSER